jgi:hypothetical protein
MAKKRYLVILSKAGYDAVSTLTDMFEGSTTNDENGPFYMRCEKMDFSGQMIELSAYMRESEDTVTLWLRHGAVLYAVDFRGNPAPGFLRD